MAETHVDEEVPLLGGVSSPSHTITPPSSPTATPVHTTTSSSNNNITNSNTNITLNESGKDSSCINNSGVNLLAQSSSKTSGTMGVKVLQADQGSIDGGCDSDACGTETITPSPLEGGFNSSTTANRNLHVTVVHASTDLSRPLLSRTVNSDISNINMDNNNTSGVSGSASCDNVRYSNNKSNDKTKCGSTSSSNLSSSFHNRDLYKQSGEDQFPSRITVFKTAEVIKSRLPFPNNSSCSYPYIKENYNSDGADSSVRDSTNSDTEDSRCGNITTDSITTSNADNIKDSNTTSIDSKRIPNDITTNSSTNTDVRNDTRISECFWKEGCGSSGANVSADDRGNSSSTNVVDAYVDPSTKVTFRIEGEEGQEDEVDRALSGSLIIEIQPVCEDKLFPFSRIPSNNKASFLSSSSSTTSMPFCRICHLPEGDGVETLISPCRCAGTMEFIHHGCLMKWLEVSSSRARQVPSCELCNYQFHRRKKFRLRQCQLPSCSRLDKILHSVFIVCLVIMLACASVTVVCFKQNSNPRVHREKTELTSAEVVTLTCGVLFFVAFFVAMYVEVKATDTLYKLCSSFFYINQTMHIYEYDRKRDAQYCNSMGSNAPV
uniref:E3 ubiquitin-protein ligase MARCH1 n=2 Tax=Hirondellea gigas TaxID=1518452 RepID=A0A6A7FS44_9CRUS